MYRSTDYGKLLEPLRNSRVRRPVAQTESVRTRTGRRTTDPTFHNWTRVTPRMMPYQERGGQWFQSRPPALTGQSVPPVPPHTPAMIVSTGGGSTYAFGQSISNPYITPLFFKMAKNLDLRCVLASAPWVLRPKHVSNPE